MTTDKRGPGFQETDEDIELRDTPPTEAEWEALDAWIFRNKDALNASIQRSREQFARGEYHSMEEVMAEALAKIRSKG
ncbi:MAG TPA: hypothetical protein VGF56_06645 [Rhizomicrobium sp.]|jgi:hypothetical protein